MRGAGYVPRFKGMHLMLRERGFCAGLDTKVLADSLKTLVAERAAALATRHDPAKPVADAPETPQTPQTPVTQAKE